MFLFKIKSCELSSVLLSSTMGWKVFLLLAISLSGLHETDANEACTTSTSSEAGECVPLHECPRLMIDLRKDQIHPTICNRELRTVCCPTKYFTTVQAIAVTEKIATRFESVEEEGPDESETFIASQIDRKCADFKQLQVRNETVSSFVLGEPGSIRKIPFCHQNENDIGIASDKEFPHTAIIKLQSRTMPRSAFGSSTKCIGSLISEQHVITSVFCVFSDQAHEVTVELGVFNFNEIGLRESFNVDEIDYKYGVAILKLNRKVVFSETVMPICLLPDENFSTQALVTGWTGDWRECDPKLKKWHVENRKLEKSRWQIKIDEAAMLNYRQVLLAGSPLQIYHPNRTCQYALVAIFEQLDNGRYTFNNLQKRLRWIENIVWPKRLLRMNEKSFNIFMKGLRSQ